MGKRRRDDGSCNVEDRMFETLIRCVKQSCVKMQHTAPTRSSATIAATISWNVSATFDATDEHERADVLPNDSFVQFLSIESRVVVCKHSFVD